MGTEGQNAVEKSPAKKVKRIEFPGDSSQVKPPEPRKRQRDLPAVLPEQDTVKQEPSAHPVGMPNSTDVVVRHEAAVAELPRGERQVVGVDRDPSLLRLSYEEYLEVYERVEAAWRLRKVEDLFMSSTQQR